MAPIFNRLIRFKTTEGQVVYGEALTESPKSGDVVKIYEGVVPWELAPTAKQAEVAEILCPLPYTPIVYGIGLNYKAHIAEAGFPTPAHPTIFTKPADALNGPYSDVFVDKECLNMDYEGEFTVIIRKDAKNIKGDENALDYVLGYTVGNDVSSRYWQMPDRSGNQHGYAKSFDGFAPIGPAIVNPSLIPDLDKLTLSTKVNGEERQNTSVGDLLFSVQECIRHLSRGTTLRPGTVIMTGTPSGVAAFEKPPKWLKDGDVVEVNITNIGTIRNKHVFKS